MYIILSSFSRVLQWLPNCPHLIHWQLTFLPSGKSASHPRLDQAQPWDSFFDISPAKMRQVCFLFIGRKTRVLQTAETQWWNENRLATGGAVTQKGVCEKALSGHSVGKSWSISQMLGTCLQFYTGPKSTPQEHKTWPGLLLSGLPVPLFPRRTENILFFRGFL